MDKEEKAAKIKQVQDELFELACTPEITVALRDEYKEKMSLLESLNAE